MKKIFLPPAGSILVMIVFSLFFICCTYSASGQGFFQKMKKKLEDKADRVSDNILNGKKKDTTVKTVTSATINEQASNTNTVYNQPEISIGRPKLSEISDADFIQSTSVPTRNENVTRYKVANNFAIDLKGKYPMGYNPKWRFINEKSPLKVTVENWIRPNSHVQYENYPIQILSYNNMAVLRLHPFMGCECFADIVIKGGLAVINETPQTFQIANFRKILNERSTGEPCNAGTNWSNSWESDGGLEGKITLSANENGDLLMDFMLEIYSSDHKNRKGELVKPSQVSRRYIAKGITIENEMSAAKANDIVAKEKEAKQRLKEYIAKTTKQADSLTKVIGKKYPQAECRNCFFSSRGGYISSSTIDLYYADNGDYARSRTDYDLNVTTSIKNTCNYPITFVGIQQSYDEQNGYYLKEVTKVMEAGYNYRSDQGVMASVFTSLIGGGSEFNFAVQDRYVVKYASVGAVQWLKVIKN